MTEQRKCALCKKRPPQGSSTVCRKCADALEREAAVEMGVEDYYEATGDLPGDS